MDDNNEHGMMVYYDLNDVSYLSKHTYYLILSVYLFNDLSKIVNSRALESFSLWRDARL